MTPGFKPFTVHLFPTFFCRSRRAKLGQKERATENLTVRCKSVPPGFHDQLEGGKESERESKAKNVAKFASSVSFRTFLDGRGHQ